MLLHQGLTDLLTTELRFSDGILPECKKTTYCEGGQTLEQVAKGGCGVFIPEDIPNPTGHSSKQPAVSDPAFNRGLD